MTPEPANEVVIIAQELAAIQGSDRRCWGYFREQAEVIWTRLLKEQKAAINAELAPDD